MNSQTLSEDDLNSVYNWIDEVPLTRPKKNIARDFADGCMMAETVAHFLPKLVEVHNYIPASSLAQKVSNWNTLNKKVFKKIGFQLSKNDIDTVVNCAPEAIERVILFVRSRIDKYLENLENKQDPAPEMPKQRQFQYNQKVIDEQNEYMPEQNQVLQSNQGGGALRDQTIVELKDTIEILELKIKKLEQLLKLKDSKIQTLQNKLAQNGIY
mmetsp:Transcript_79886/g.93365  ORF Transcript_79886/g.93365 Transcript_79886/m.93365 type:complete len:212 (-) Transcript_79886:59-694(-)